MIRRATLLACSMSLQAFAGDVVLDTFVFEDFSSSKVNEFPKGWKARGWKSKAENVYSVKQEDNNRFLHAIDHGEDVQIGKYESWDVKEFPILSFRWRAHQLPTNAAENNTKSNDSAAGIYVIFKGGILVPPGIKYVWSTTLPVADTNMSYKDTLKCLVLQTGAQRLGKWTTHEVDVLAHYQKHFHTTDIPKIQGIGILTDANATKSVAEADYDDFTLRRKLSGTIAAGMPSLSSDASPPLPPSAGVHPKEGPAKNQTPVDTPPKPKPGAQPPAPVDSHQHKPGQGH